MDARSIAEFCIDIHCKERDALIKICMDNAFEKMNSMEPTDNDDTVPTDSSIFTFVPRKNQFVDYATEIVRSVVPIEQIRTELMIPVIKTLRRTSKNKRIGVIEEEEDEPKHKRCNTHKCETIVDPKPINLHLPEVLNPTSSGSMTSVSREYFPDSEFVFPGIYATPSGRYVLFCVDNGRYAKSWVHENNVTRFTWVTATKDKNRMTLESISCSTDVHVFRKIQGELTFRYMGRVIETGPMDKKAGSIELSVC